MRGFYTGEGPWAGVCFDVLGAGTAVSGVANAAASIASAETYSSAARDVADTYTQATKYGDDQLQSRYDNTRGDLMPFQQAGDASTGILRDTAPYYNTASDGFLAGMNNSDPSVNAYSLVAAVPGVQNTSVVPGTQNTSVVPTAQNNSTVPGSMSQAELEATPGYQFTRDQGLQAVQNSAAARGLGVSGAALKGAATYATGLANATYKDQFAIKQQQFSDALNKDQQNFGQGQNIYTDQFNKDQQAFTQGQSQFGDELSKDNQNFGQTQNQFNDLYQQTALGFNQQQQKFSNQQALGNTQQQWLTNSENRLLGISQLGENAASQTGSTGATIGAAQANNAMSGASGSAAATTMGANATAGGYNGLANAFGQYNAQQVASGNGNWLTGGSSSSSSPFDSAGTTNYSQFDY